MGSDGTRVPENGGPGRSRAQRNALRSRLQDTAAALKSDGRRLTRSWPSSSGGQQAVLLQLLENIETVKQGIERAQDDADTAADLCADGLGTSGAPAALGRLDAGIETARDAVLAVLLAFEAHDRDRFGPQSSTYRSAVNQLGILAGLCQKLAACFRDS